MLDSVTREVVERSGHDGRSSGVGNTDYPLVPMEKEIADYTPVGDAMQAVRAAGDALNGHLGKAVLGAGLLFVPNSIEKAAKPVIQSFKGGASRALRHAPVQTIGYEDALLRPYKGQNFVHHDVDGEYVRDVLHGETRLMSPSLAVNRWGDYNDIYTPGFYGDHVLIGDRSMLKNSKLFNGDGMTPTVREVWYGMDSVPSDMREKVSDDIWRLMERENVGKNVITDVKDLERLDLPFSDQYFEAKYRGTYPIENFRYGVFPEPKDAVGEKVLREFEERGLPIETYKQVGGNEGYNNKVEAMLKVLNENQGLLFTCGGKKYPGGGKFFRTNLQNESPLMYQPILPSYPDVPTPMRYEPQPHYGLYEYPSTTGMAENYPVTLPPRVPVTVSRSVSAPEVVEVPTENLFSDEMVARRALKQRYAESAFNDKAKSKAGAQGAWQIMPITLKDYLGRGRGKSGDLNDPEYNRKVRDWVMGIIPRDLQEFWSDSDSDRAKLAKLYAAYNWGAGNLRGFLRKKQKAGVDISNPDNWVDDLNPETRRYVKYLAFDEDIPDSTVYTNAAFEKAAAEREYASGGKIRIKPENRGKFTALKKRTGHSASWFKAHGTPAQKKMAVFALNSKKWKHGDGGPIDRYSPEQIRAAIAKLKETKK